MLNEATAAPITRAVNGEEYMFGRFTLSDFGKLEQSIKDRIRVEAVQLASRAEDETTKRIILEDANKEARAVNMLNGEFMTEALQQVPNLVTLFQLSLSHCHEGITPEKAEAIFDALDNEVRNTLLGEILGSSEASDNEGSKKKT